MGGWPTPRLNFSSGIQVVTFFAMLGEIKAGVFIFRRKPEPNDLVDNEEQEKRADAGKGPGDCNSSGLVQQLAPMSVDGAGGCVRSKCGIDGPCREKTG